MTTKYAIILVLLCAGCAKKEAPGLSEPSSSTDRPTTKAAYWPIVVYLDDKTGCQYISAGGDNAPLVPRKDADGQHICSGGRP